MNDRPINCSMLHNREERDRALEPAVRCMIRYCKMGMSSDEAWDRALAEGHRLDLLILLRQQWERETQSERDREIIDVLGKRLRAEGVRASAWRLVAKVHGLRGAKSPAKSLKQRHRRERRRREQMGLQSSTRA